PAFRPGSRTRRPGRGGAGGRGRPARAGRGSRRPPAESRGRRAGGRRPAGVPPFFGSPDPPFLAPRAAGDGGGAQRGGGARRVRRARPKRRSLFSCLKLPRTISTSG